MQQLARDVNSSAVLNMDRDALKKRRLRQQKEMEFSELRELVFSLIERIELLENVYTN